MSIIAPSILSADFGRLAEEITAVEAAGADWIHVDVMDGHFVPNITMGPLVVEAVRRATTLPIDVHLMITDPDAFVADFAKAGADNISVHAETCPHLHRSVAHIKDCGAKAGAVLNPSTPLTAIDWVLEDLDFVLIMSVNPGFGGQHFISSSLSKLSALRRIAADRHPDLLIEVDGGVNTDTIADIAAAGADAFVAGSAIFGSDDYETTITEFRSLIDKGRGA